MTRAKVTPEQIREMKGRGEQIAALTAYDFPMTRVLEEGGYRIKGKNDPEREAVLADAQALTDAGAFAMVLELVAPAVAAEITRRVPIPTIGIGSGKDCDGQILVVHDLLGLWPWYQ